MTYTLITSTEQLESACHQLSQHQVIAVDTEFKRETTYFPIPCLFQLASTESTICIDPFQIDNLAPLGDLLSNKSIIKIFHAGRQDLEIFYYLFKQLPAPIFDTQIAAAILGFPSQVGYAKLVSDYMGIELDKSLTRADWEKRPLPEKQLEYAANDVIYLLQVYDKQIEALKDTGRLDWPDADCEALLDESLYRPDPLSAWTKMRNYNYFTSQERAVASAICQWREELAIERNRPRKFIFDNPVISELSTHQPATLGALESLKNIPPFVSRKFGKELIDIIQIAMESDIQPAEPVFERLSEKQSKLVKDMQKVIKQVSEAENIEATTICGKKEIEKLVRGKKNLNILNGWRYELVGKELNEMLD